MAENETTAESESLFSAETESFLSLSAKNENEKEQRIQHCMAAYLRR